MSPARLHEIQKETEGLWQFHEMEPNLGLADERPYSPQCPIATFLGQAGGPLGHGGTVGRAFCTTTEPEANQEIELRPYGQAHTVYIQFN